MDYKQKYEEVLEKARIYRNHLLETGDDTNEIEYIFPELCESEDEKIRKSLIDLIKGITSWNYFLGISREQMISWLEKQSKQKLIEEYDVPNIPIKDSEVVTSRMKYIDDNLKPIAKFVMDYANWDLRKDEWNHPVATVPLFRVLDALAQNVKQYSEEHHVIDNNTKPKFKVGDWITNGEYTWKVIEVKHLDYILRSQDGNVVDYTISHVDGLFHSFTIEDANDGDVLITKNGHTFIYDKDRYNNGLAYYYVGIGVNNELTCKSKYKILAHFGRLTDTYPATKEQRDLLFQKMEEAGYTWDEKKKQLIKKQS